MNGKRPCALALCTLVWLGACALAPPGAGAQGAGGDEVGTAAPAPYRMLLHPTARAGAARAEATLRLAPSPFGVTVSRTGHYPFDIELRVAGLRAPGDQALVVWAARRDLSEFRKLGVVDPEGRAAGRVDWNKFLLLVTREPSGEVAERSGPVLLRGVSPSGLLAALAGHDLFSGGMPH